MVMVDFLDRACALLVQILNSPRDRVALIHELQMLVSEAEGQLDQPAYELLNDLGDILDYFEPDPIARGESPEFFGEARLQSEVERALDGLGCGRSGYSPLCL